MGSEWVNHGTDHRPRYEHVHADGTRHRADRTIPDQRENRADDKKTMVFFARIAMGGGPDGYLAPSGLRGGEGEDDDEDDMVIEGHAVEVKDEQ